LVAVIGLASGNTPSASASQPEAAFEITSAGTHTVGLVDPTQGKWHLYDGAGIETTSFYYGNPGDYPIMGDWDGDGVDTPGLYRQSNGYVYLRNSNSQGNADINFFFGNPGDVPIAGDFNGDGFDTVSIYRPSQARFYIINTLGSNNAGLGPAEFDYVFGNPGDKPFVGDFDRDGIETVGLHRESTGLVYFRNEHSHGNADNQFTFGNPGDRLVAGDWTGNGEHTPALFRPSSSTTYFRNSNTSGNADVAFIAGDPQWLPVAGDFGRQPIRIRVLTFNIHHGEGGDGVIDLERIADVINSVSPDLVGLQEVENGTTRTGGVDQTAVLAALTSMNGVFGHNLDFRGGGFGNAILSRWPITGSVNHLLPSYDSGEQRGVLEATIGLPHGVSARFLSTHLDDRDDSTERLLSVTAINDLVATFGGQPVVLAGDLNARPADEEIQILASTWLTHTGAELYSHPAIDPDKQLDYVAARTPAQWRIVSARVLDDAVASDHRAILMVLELAP
jgi:endonuclease/exonuclease/phosphatase family metal-dependent hydrolase